MPDNGLTGQGTSLFNHETGAYEWVPAAGVAPALQSGKYTSEGNVQSIANGGVVTRTPEQLSAAATQGEAGGQAVTAVEGAASRQASRVDANSDKVMTFAEGVVDALSLGFLHGTSEEDELRRQADSGTALLGQLTGTIVGLGTPGLVSGVTKGGEALGKMVAKTLLKRGTGAIARGVEEAAANAALMSATAFGHQITDAVIADKPFSAEVVAHEAGLGSVIGFGFGWLGSTFGKLARASRGAVEASGVASAEAGAALAGVRDITGVLDSAVETHAQRLGVLDVLAKEGHVPGEFMAGRKAALKEAESAKAELDKLSTDGAFTKGTKEYQGWRDAVERYDGAVRSLDEQMRPQMLEQAAMHPVELGARVHPDYMPGGVAEAEGREMAAKAAGAVPAVDTMVSGGRSNWKGAYDFADTTVAHDPSLVLDRGMTPELRAQYEVLHGKPYEEMPYSAPKGEENLGGKSTPTSENATKPGSTPNGLASQEVAGAGQPVVSPAENGVKFAESIKGGTEGAPITANPVEPGTPRPQEIASTGERSAIQQYMDNWIRESGSTARISPGDMVDARMSEVLDKLNGAGSRMDSAGSLELGKAMNLKPAATTLGERLDQVWSMHQAGKFAADEARGVATPLRKGLIGALQRYAVRKAVRGALGAATGAAAGGPLGAILGYALTSAGFAGSVASASGKMMGAIAKTGEALLKGPRLKIAVRAIAGNRPYQYDETGPIKDPIQRILAVQRLAADPERLRTQVRNQLGDLVLMSPELSQSLEDTAIKQIQSISVSAPAIFFSPLGQPVAPTGTALRRFFEFENAVHNLPELLQSISSGAATEQQIRALHVAFPAAHAHLVRNIMSKVEVLQKMSAANLHGLENVLGIPLTRSGADPAFTMRMQTDWQSENNQPVGKAQALKITAPPPTPVQAGSSGKAPGNETK